MTGWEWLSLALGVGIGASWQHVRPGGVLDLRVQRDDLRRRVRELLDAIWLHSNHPAGRNLTNVVPLPRRTTSGERTL